MLLHFSKAQFKQSYCHSSYKCTTTIMYDPWAAILSNFQSVRHYQRHHLLFVSSTSRYKCRLYTGTQVGKQQNQNFYQEQMQMKVHIVTCIQVTLVLTTLLIITNLQRLIFFYQNHGALLQNYLDEGSYLPLHTWADTSLHLLLRRVLCINIMEIFMLLAGV